MKSIDYQILIHKKLTGQISTEESFQLENWLNESDENRTHYEQTSEIWKLSQQYTSSFTPDVSRAIKEQLGRIREDSTQSEAVPKIIRMKPVTWAMRIAAVLILLLAVVFIFKPTATVIASGDEALFATLEDGTEVWLKPSTSLRLGNDYNSVNRSLDLDGEAFFNVVPMENVPFIVNAGQLEVQVLGTSYAVGNRDGMQPYVAVRSGKVQVNAGDQSSVLVKDEKIVLENNSLIPAALDKKEFDWTNPNLSFKNAPLSAVFSDLENFFDIQISYRGKLNLDNCLFTNKSMKESTIDEIFMVLQLTYDMEVTKPSEKVYQVSDIRCK